jgi:hypothetical protein
MAEILNRSDQKSPRVNSELGSALILANRVLDQHWRDPDDDLSILARQLIRTSEQLRKLRDQVAVDRD